MKGNLYEILGVKKNASKDDIEIAYSELREKNQALYDQGDQEASITLFSIKSAYDVLACPAKREKYDETILGKTFHSTEMGLIKSVDIADNNASDSIPPIAKAGYFEEMQQKQSVGRGYDQSAVESSTGHKRKFNSTLLDNESHDNLGSDVNSSLLSNVLGKPAILIGILSAIVTMLTWLYLSTAKHDIDGSVFVRMKIGNSVKLGSVTVSAIPEKELLKYLEALKLNELKEEDTLEAEIKRARVVSEDAYFTTLQSQLSTYKNEVKTPEAMVSDITLEPVASGLSDADGVFNLKLPAGRYVFKATTSRHVLDSVEDYAWLILTDASDDQKRILLTNSNMVDTNCADCIKLPGDSDRRLARISRIKAELADKEERESKRLQEELKLKERAELERLDRARKFQERQILGNLYVEEYMAKEREAKIREIGRSIAKLEASIPTWDAYYRVPHNCEVDAKPANLILCVNHKMKEEEKYERRYAPTRKKILDLEKSLDSLGGRPF